MSRRCKSIPNNNVASVVVIVLMQLYILQAHECTQKSRNQGNKQKAVIKRKSGISAWTYIHCGDFIRIRIIAPFCSFGCWMDDYGKGVLA